MRWQRGQRSSDLEDRRFEGQSRGRRGGGLKLGLGGILLLGVLSLVFKQNFFTLLDTGGGGGVGISNPGAGAGAPVERASAAEEDLVDFVSFVLDDTQGVWNQLVPRYRRAHLVLFRDAIDSACGFANAASGPFYCPADEKVYIDLGFYQELHQRFGAPGDFAQAYVLAHEIGHHVQNVLGLEDQMRQAQRARPNQAKQLSVRFELQADCFAGVWANSTNQRQLLERGDVEEGLGAAAAVGDDRIQRMSGQRVSPESFTHGSSAQRVDWFRKGFSTGDPNACDTFR